MSFNIALTGLQATTQDLNTISNNIANSSTVGYRGGRSEFSAIYNGGQAGGVNVMSTSQNFSMEGSLNRTGRELDMGIQGDGFFVLNSQDGSTLYSRAGMFNQDANGFITDPTGNHLQGYPAGAAGQLQKGNVTDLKVQSAALTAKATSSIGLVSNLNSEVDAIDQVKVPFDANDASSYHTSNTAVAYDSLGKEHALNQYYVKTDTATWSVHYTMDGEDVTPATGQEMKFDANGQLISGDKLTLDIAKQDILDGASALKIAVNYQHSTQTAGDFSKSSISQNGYSSGELNGIRLDDNGNVYGTYTNGQEQLQGQVVLADFNNPNGLTPTSNNAWTATNAAGQPIIGSPKTGTLGSIVGGSLEGSNVDTTQEMVSLMTAQRNYQSNAKVLDANSTMYQALLNTI
ncbi:flagellar basal body protein FlgE [Shewanella sp. VB17]|uniref:flagellar hook protein FlgE n=1 Tax=Shewanella sp. VB17 TaxID=2739432 RepID=UPI0015642511|nr:flagellar hook protein FlgE [Shewanella sp. VB17]NRD72007.1 flagellar basal body protein FlgE [Shewanella sp. VB17]